MILTSAFLLEQTSIFISSISADSAVVSLSCGTEQSRNIEYSVQDQQEISILDFILNCGESRLIVGIMPRRQYMLVRTYTSQIECVIGSFETDTEGMLCLFE